MGEFRRRHRGSRDPPADRLTVATGAILAFFGRDSLVGTTLGIFTGTWLAFGLTSLTSPPGQTSPVLGVFFLAVAAIFMMLTGGGWPAAKPPPESSCSSARSASSSQGYTS